jgi:HNH endonuclease
MHYKRKYKHGDPLWEPSERSCNIEGCDRRHYGKGLCQLHWQRLHRTGDPEFSRKTSSDEIDCFMQETLVSATDDCIVWPYGKFKSGYGSYGRSGLSSKGAHAYVCLMTHGEKPAPDHQVRHLCGERACVNPRHLRWGTPTENSADRWTHGTIPFGESHHWAKRSVPEVMEIKRRLGAGESQRSIARDLDVDPSYISAISRGKIWKHLD